MNKRHFSRALLLTLCICCFPLVSHGEEPSFCVTLKAILENSPNQYAKFRGVQINNDPESLMWVGRATFGAVNDCTIVVGTDDSYYECSSGKFDSDSQKIHLLWSSMAKLAADCLVKENGNWVGRENTRDGKKTATHDFEFVELNVARIVIVKLTEKKRSDEPSLWKTTIVISGQK
jgi:hypothetical protein